MDNIQILLFEKDKILPFIDEIAQLRISIFREFPYLYEGNLNYEKKYLHKFTKAKNSMMVIAFDNKKVVGALTGLPLNQEDKMIQQPWSNQNITNTYYFSEILLYQQYRGLGLGKKMFEIGENWATNHHYKHFTLASVIREENHPLKPFNYQSSDIFWKKLGYFLEDNIICKIVWKEIEETIESEKPLIFWSKHL